MPNLMPDDLISARFCHRGVFVDEYKLSGSERLIAEAAFDRGFNAAFALITAPRPDTAQTTRAEPQTHPQPDPPEPQP